MQARWCVVDAFDRLVWGQHHRNFPSLFDTGGYVLLDSILPLHEILGTCITKKRIFRVQRRNGRASWLLCSMMS